MTHPHHQIVAQASEALNRHDPAGFVSAFAEDAVMHGSAGRITGRDSIRGVIEQVISLSENTVHIDVHDILSNDEHTVVLQTTTARLGDRTLQDRVVYVFHLADDLIREAFFVGDPRVQENFYGLT